MADESAVVRKARAAWDEETFALTDVPGLRQALLDGLAQETPCSRDRVAACPPLPLKPVNSRRKEGC